MEYALWLKLEAFVKGWVRNTNPIEMDEWKMLTFFSQLTLDANIPDNYENMKYGKS